MAARLRRSAAEWRRMIDSVWGPGVPTVEKLAIFDQVRNHIDSSFACFHNVRVDWDSLVSVYRAEVSAGVSRGRFASIMNRMALALGESHTAIHDNSLNLGTRLQPGVPLLVVGGWGEVGHFGAGLTPLPDRSLLVYSAVASHPLGLVPGDIVLGYDGMAWHEIYRELLAAELPLAKLRWWGSSVSSYEHTFLASAGVNWHLFDTIDIVRQATGDTVHLATSAMRGKSMRLITGEQIDIPGVPKPDFVAGGPVSHGIIDGTNIGYIYVWRWTETAGEDFLEAVDALLSTDGMIIDFRINYGGNMALSNDGLEKLFPTTVRTIDFAVRCPTGERQPLCTLGIPEAYDIPGAFPGYQQPIAVLTGPGAISSGDQVALRMTYHPGARLFGKPTSASFNSPRTLTPAIPGWAVYVAVGDAYRVSEPSISLTGHDIPVDTAVWHTVEAAAAGRDNVVDAARAWIERTRTSGLPSAPVDAGTHLGAASPNPAEGPTVIPFTVGRPGPVVIEIHDGMQRPIARPLDRFMQPGSYTTTIDASELPSGVYHVRMRIGDLVETTRLVVVR